MEIEPKLIEWSLDRKQGGIELYFKSKMLHDFFESYGKISDINFEWSGNMPFNYKKFKYFNDNLSQKMSNGWRGNIMNGHTPNMAFLFAQELDKGVKFHMKQPYAEKEIRLFERTFPQYVSDYYSQYIMPLHIREVVKLKENIRKTKLGLEMLEKLDRKVSMKGKGFTSKMSLSELRKSLLDLGITTSEPEQETILRDYNLNGLSFQGGEKFIEYYNERMRNGNNIKTQVGNSGRVMYKDEIQDGLWYYVDTGGLAS